MSEEQGLDASCIGYRLCAESVNSEMPAKLNPTSGRILNRFFRPRGPAGLDRLDARRQPIAEGDNHRRLGPRKENYNVRGS